MYLRVKLLLQSASNLVHREKELLAYVIKMVHFSFPFRDLFWHFGIVIFLMLL